MEKTRIQLPVGCKFIFNGRIVEVVKDENEIDMTCRSCALYHNDSGKIEEFCLYQACIDSDRDDKTDIHYEFVSGL